MDWSAVLESFRRAVWTASVRSGPTDDVPDEAVRWLGPLDYISDRTGTGIYLRDMSTRYFGQPERKYTENGSDDLTVTTARQGVWTIEVQVVSLLTDGPGLAKSQLSDLVASLEEIDLTADGIELADIGPIVVTARELGDFEYEVATLDLTVNLVENRDGQPVSYIGTVDPPEGTYS